MPDAADLRGRDRRAVNAAGRAGLTLAIPGALVLTDQRLLTVRFSPVGVFGPGGRVEEVLSAVPVEDVAGMDVEEGSAGQSITLRVRGQSIALLAYLFRSGGALASTLRSLKG
ncbi:MAG TPA: hypothetical protein VFZ77_05880 [Acidimicrobiales bacterium]